MESTRFESGVCYECSSKNKDTSQQKVSHCELCDKWFCEKHAEPRLPYFTEWEDVRGIPCTTELKVLYYKERKLKGGHPDVAYLRKKLAALGIEENKREEVLKPIIGRMTQSKNIV